MAPLALSAIARPARLIAAVVEPPAKLTVPKLKSVTLSSDNQGAVCNKPVPLGPGLPQSRGPPSLPAAWSSWTSLLSGIPRGLCVSLPQLDHLMLTEP